MSTVPPDERPDDASDRPSPSISDDELESFLREAAEGGGAPAPEEPSARARMVTARLRAQEEAARRAPGGGGRGKWPRRKRRTAGASAGTPEGWRTGPAWQEMNGTRTRRRRAGAVIGVALAVALAAVAVRPSLVTDRLPGGGPEAAASPTPLPAETALPSGAPGQVAGAGGPTRERPFRGSPALRWADGAEAIELPAAKAVAGMSKADVELALRRTKEFLVAANLDPAVIAGGRPEKALALLDPEAPDLLPDLRRALREPTREHDPVGLFSRFAPDDVRLAGDVVKVRGHMSFAAGDPGEIEVHADYTFVYPLVRSGGGDHVERTIVRRDITTLLLDPDRWIATRGKLAIKTYNVETYNNACEVYDGYLHPVFPEARATGAPATGPAADPYDRSQAVGATEHEGCGTVTRT
ncbi:hypothetical protein [Streptomyces pactum]|uniref:Uncharacterized protein n=1 Tax=Streptomyces pactum TaxID=68249 RepID=A0A1S6JJR3_9ACTN|nr:hypothetical protein [Streptomyces pactum]AQS71994.1 hypothetical protein B1H29_15105 [Streptomyces pactum]